jgi:hypothetical protein
MNENELKEYIERGLSISQISDIKNKSKSTIRYWLKKFRLKTNFKPFSQEPYIQTSVKRIDGRPIQNCSCCGILLTKETGYWRKEKELWASQCKKCSNKKTGERWKNSKKRAVEYKGGKCERCGYDKCIDALEFHHINPTEKDKNFGNIKLRKWETQKKELDKCIMVCSNCHREIHSELRLDIN